MRNGKVAVMRGVLLVCFAVGLMIAPSALAQSDYCAECNRGSMPWPGDDYGAPGVMGTLCFSTCDPVSPGDPPGRFGCLGVQVWTDGTCIAWPDCEFVGNSCEVYGPPCDQPGCGGNQDNDDNCGNQCSPLELNLGNGPWRHSGAEDPVSFDLDIDGVKEKTAWPARGSQIAFLAIDHGLDGVIASGAELFGNRPGYFVNGFETLKAYDSNHDGIIDHNDSVWPFLRLWTDVNHDGVSAGELQTLDEAGVQGLDLTYHETSRADRGENEFRQQAIYWRNGQVRPYYDVWLARVP